MKHTSIINLIILHLFAQNFSWSQNYSEDSLVLIDVEEKQNYTPLIPSAFMADETKWLLGALEKAHFKKLSIRELDTTLFLENFISNLDKQKLFFTKSDISRFKTRYQPTILTYLRQGNLFPAFEMYEEYRNQAIERLKIVIESLNQAPDLDTNHSYNIDRSELVWPENQLALNDVWNRLLTHEYINEVFSQMDENESLDETLKLLPDRDDAILKSLKKKYNRWIKNISEFEATDVQELYLTTLTQMFDPHTSFLNIKEKEKFDQAMHNEFVGIGAVLTDVDGYCTIKELLPGGPAEASRELEPEDVILKVAQGGGEFVDVVDMKLSKIVELIKGPKNTPVLLKIRPIETPNSSKTVRIIRDKIKLTANLASASMHKIENSGDELLLGVVELPSFYGSSGEGHKATDDVEELINLLKDQSMQGLVLDLRRNGGGYLSEAVNLAGLFISRGPIVQVKSSDGKIRKKFDFNPKLVWDGPLVVLVSRYSASASEIVAGALKNHRRALIVGDESTHGKGTVQSLLPINMPFAFSVSGGKKSAAKITIQKYYLPSGESTQLTGVSSDISLHSINKYLPIGESDLDNALAWDKISEVNFRRPEGEFKYSEKTVENLLISSKERQSSTKEFDYLEKNISWFRKKRNQKSVSLNLSNRLQTNFSDLNKTHLLNEEYKSLADLSFPLKEFELQVVKEQKQKSLAVRGIKTDSNSTSTKFPSFAKPKNLDIRLHEGLRILKDWVNSITVAQVLQSQHSAKKKI